MNALYEGAAEVCRFMSERNWQYCLIGGLAVQRWGQPRTTLDADITLFAGWGSEKPFIDALLEHFDSRISDARTFALNRRVLLIRTATGTDVDIILGALPFEEAMVRRAAPLEFAPGICLPCCTAEDLFVMKAFADRPRDWLDAESVAVRQPDLDVPYVLGHLATLCELKEAPEILARARHLLGKMS